MDLKLLKMLCKDRKQHHVMFHELYSVSLLLCIAQNVRFEIPYKVLYFETPFLIIFKYYAWESCGFPPKILQKHCFQFLLGMIINPREIENNAYVFWGGAGGQTKCIMGNSKIPN